MAKIGIFSGTFDPVHSGHIAFALGAVRLANLDSVYFTPEPLPRRKIGVTHYAHRLKMLEIATKAHERLNVLELPDKQFSVNKTMPRLKGIFPDDELYMLIGSDMLRMLDSSSAVLQWPGYQAMLKEFTLISGVRSTDNEFELTEVMSCIQKEGLVVDTEHSHISSSDIRGSIMRGKEHSGALSSIGEYISQNWLYVSVEPNKS